MITPTLKSRCVREILDRKGHMDSEGWGRRFAPEPAWCSADGPTTEGKTIVVAPADVGYTSAVKKSSKIHTCCKTACRRLIRHCDSCGERLPLNVVHVIPSTLKSRRAGDIRECEGAVES